MKIAIVRQKCGTDLGGAEAYCEHAARHLKDKGHQVHVVAAASHPTDIPIIHAPTYGRGSIAKNLSFFLSAKKALSSQHFDCIYGLSRIEGADFLRISDPLHAAWIEEGYRDRLIPPPLRRVMPRHLSLLWQERRAIESARYIITNSKLVKSQVRRFYKVSGNKIFTIYNGVDLDRFSPLDPEERLEVRAGLGIGERAKVVIFSGRDPRRKGLDILLNATAQLKRRYDFFLVVAGIYAQRGLIDRCRELGILERVRFLGFRTDIEKIFGAGDILCLPTYYDPFANVCLEAMACGLPVITTRLNGAAEIIEQICPEFVTDTPDVSAMAKALGSFMEMNREGQRKLSRAFGSKAKELTWQNHVQELDSLFQRFCSWKNHHG